MYTDKHGPDDVISAPIRFQHVARGDVDFPVAAYEAPDGVVLARELQPLLCVGEGEDLLSFFGLAHLAVLCLACALRERGSVSL